MKVFSVIFQKDNALYEGKISASDAVEAKLKVEKMKNINAFVEFEKDGQIKEGDRVISVDELCIPKEA